MEVSCAVLLEEDELILERQKELVWDGRSLICKICAELHHDGVLMLHLHVLLEVQDQVLQLEFEAGPSKLALVTRDGLILSDRSEDDAHAFLLFDQELEEALILVEDPVSRPPDHLRQPLLIRLQLLKTQY